ncbi:MAG: hypothetical protein AAB498_01335 [Patescibacteria group bacterium]
MLSYNIVKDKSLRLVFGLSFLILVLEFIFVYLKLIGADAPFLVIHFDVYKGIDFIGGKTEIFGVLFSFSAMLVINLFLAEFLYYRERFLSYLFGFIGLWLSILILIAVSVIISVN